MTLMSALILGIASATLGAFTHIQLENHSKRVKLEKAQKLMKERNAKIKEINLLKKVGD